MNFQTNDKNAWFNATHDHNSIVDRKNILHRSQNFMVKYFMAK